jgi:hypothetical protein
MATPVTMVTSLFHQCLSGQDKCTAGQGMGDFYNHRLWRMWVGSVNR